MNSKIFLFSGKAGHGKDTACDYFKGLLEKDNKKVVHTLYAKYIKMYAKDYFNWNGEEETKPRELLQTLGTNIIRNKLKSPDFHVNRICEDIEILSEYFDTFLISDTRFPNEVLVPKKKFGDSVKTIRIIRPYFIGNLTEEQQQHESEIALDNFNNFDYIIYAKNLKELYNELNYIYRKEFYNEKA